MFEKEKSHFEIILVARHISGWAWVVGWVHHQFQTFEAGAGKVNSHVVEGAGLSLRGDIGEHHHCPCEFFQCSHKICFLWVCCKKYYSFSNPQFEHISSLVLVELYKYILYILKLVSIR